MTSALLAHLSNQDVAFEGCKAVQEWASTINETGCIGAVLSVVREHMYNHVVLEGCKAIQKLASDNQTNTSTIIERQIIAICCTEV